MFFDFGGDIRDDIRMLCGDIEFFAGILFDIIKHRRIVFLWLFFRVTRPRDEVRFERTFARRVKFTAIIIEHHFALVSAVTKQNATHVEAIVHAIEWHRDAAELHNRWEKIET